MYRHILIANDGSDGALRALDAAIELASALGARLHMISVEEALPKHAETIDEIEEEKEEEDSYFGKVAAYAWAKAVKRNIELQCTVVRGHEVKSIVDFARENGCDLLVVGFMGHSRLYDRIWGGTSQNLARLAPCSVLVVK
ncbi:MAG: universal stress protein [Bryobacteraceae bacterium]|jgi:nucleotide-binding universal stress UspA family protein